MGNKALKAEKANRRARIADAVSRKTVATRHCGKGPVHDEHLYYSRDAFGANRAMHCTGRMR